MRAERALSASSDNLAGDPLIGSAQAAAGHVGAFLQPHPSCADKRGAGVAAHSDTGAAADAGARSPKPMPAVRTFIVEDSPIILDNLVATLEEMAPVRVVGSAADESSAVARLAQLQDGVDLIIIDVFLKAGSGLGVLRGATQSGLRAKRVVLTNYATADMRDKCKALGADHVFDKSNDLDELLSYCTRLAEGGATTPGVFS